MPCRAGHPRYLYQQHPIHEQSDARLNAIAAGQYKLIYVAPERLDTSYFQYIRASAAIHGRYR